MSSSALYLDAAEELRPNNAQWQAYESTGHCVVLAGPGSGKTKTLTIKLARILAEDVKAPRGVACITYNNECARELEDRLGALGVEPGKRVFVGTVHSFSLTQILIPYAESLDVGLPSRFQIANAQQKRVAMARLTATWLAVPAIRRISGSAWISTAALTWTEPSRYGPKLTRKELRSQRHTSSICVKLA